MNKTKMNKKNQGDTRKLLVMDISITLTVVTVSEVAAHVPAHRTVYITYVLFFAHQLHHTKAVKKASCLWA